MHCMLGASVGEVLKHCMLGAAVGEFFGALCYEPLYVRFWCAVYLGPL